MTAERVRFGAMALFVLIVLTALVVSVTAQDVLVGNHRFTGPTASRIFTLPDANATLATSATAGAWKFAAGTVTLDGTNPSSATTGLATIVACAVMDKRATAPADEVSTFTSATGAVAGRLDVYAWVGSATDPTLAASTDADDTIDWICIGT